MTIGWRIWRLDTTGTAPQLASPVQAWARDMVSAPVYWWKNTAYARCFRCHQPPGQYCNCGIYLCPFIDHFADLVNQINDRRARGSDNYFLGQGTPAITTGNTVDERIYPDRDPRYHGRMVRTAGYRLRNIILWPENADATEAMNATYPGVPIWSTSRPDRKLLELSARVAAAYETETTCDS